MNEITRRSGMDIYRQLLRLALQGQSGILMLAVLGMAMEAATGPALSALMKPILDGAIVEQQPDVIRWVPLALIGIFVLRAVGSYLSASCMAQIGARLVRDLRRKMFTRLLEFPAETHDHTASSDFLARITSHVEGVTTAASKSLTVLIRDSLMVIGLVGWMLYVSWILTVAFLAAVPVFAWLIPSSNRRVRKLSHRMMEALTATVQNAQEVIQGYRVVKVFQAETMEKTRFDETTEHFRKRQVRTQQMAALVSSVIMLLVGLAWAGIVYLVTLEGVLSTITVGGFVSFMFAMLMLLAPARNLVQVNTRLQQSIAAGQQVFQMLDTPAEQDQGEHSKQDLQHSIVYDRISLRYRNADREALRNVSLTIRRGETVALVGRSGSGKSSLANLLPRFYAPQSGEIRVDDIPINDLQLSDLRGLISYVGQNVVLFNDTVRNNITYGVDPDQQHDLELALRSAHVDEFVTHLPQGLETIIGEGGVQLSGGQRQRLALARALYKRAPILILDEATSSLDSESERYVQEALDRIMEVSTTLIIAHRLSTVERADRIVVLDQGEVVEQGTHEELIQRNQVYRKLYQHQFQDTGDVEERPPRRGELLEEESTRHQSWVTRFAETVWYGDSRWVWALRPLSWLYRTGVFLRRLWRRWLNRPAALPVPVAVIGNLSVGGTGKTPLVVWLALRLRSLGVSVGIVCRGYRGDSPTWPREVDAATSPDEVGEEAVLIAAQTGCPVFAGPDRVAAAQALCERHTVSIILSDDGLQHLGLSREIEILVVDGKRRHGNGLCLPAGPLREPLGRARLADWILVHGGDPEPGEHRFDLQVKHLRSLLDGSTTPLSSFAGQTVHAVCGIGNPHRFLESLASAGIDAIPHLYEDHHAFRAGQLDFADGHAVIMTPKDAVKCERFARERWYSLEVDVALEPVVAEEIIGNAQRAVEENRKAKALDSLDAEART
ncbi:MAG: lipid A export permease/ATP-binding protein MsbA [Gammaproteobacteria bacterium]|nr:lipid A export permease/ATP-binding protein MsbA [Gammaproteobacteria bacterium]